MIDTLISSQTRLKLLLKFFLNPDSRAYLRGLETEFGESTNGIRVELNRFEKAGLIESETTGNKKFFKANIHHPIFGDIRNIVLKYLGFDKIIDNILNRLGQLKAAYVVGDYAKGLDTGIIDLVLVGNIDKAYLIKKIDKAELLIKRKIRFVIYLEEEFNIEGLGENFIAIWKE